MSNDNNKSTVLSMFTNSAKGEVKAVGIGSHLWSALLELIEEKAIRVEYRNGGPATLTLA